MSYGRSRVPGLTEAEVLRDPPISPDTPSVVVLNYPVPNARTARSFRVLCPVFNALPPAARWVQIPDMDVIDGFSLVFKAWPLNPLNSLVFIAENGPATTNPDSSYPLLPNESYALRVKNAGSFYASATVGACYVIIATEMRR